MKNYLKLVASLFSNEQLFYFDDNSKEDAQRALAEAQDVRKQHGLDSAGAPIVVFKAVRYGRIPGVAEIGKTSGGVGLHSIGQRAGMSLGAAQSNLIGLPRIDKADLEESPDESEVA